MNEYISCEKCGFSGFQHIWLGEHVFICGWCSERNITFENSIVEESDYEAYLRFERSPLISNKKTT